jgi:hypothetical protein
VLGFTLGCLFVYMLVIPALWRLRQEDCEFKANLGYKESSCLKKASPPPKKKKKKMKKIQITISS